jgi:hypothetical protein
MIVATIVSVVGNLQLKLTSDGKTVNIRIHFDRPLIYFLMKNM